MLQLKSKMPGRKKKQEPQEAYEPLPGQGQIINDGDSVRFSNGAIFKRIVLPAAFVNKPDESGVDLSELDEESL